MSGIVTMNDAVLRAEEQTDGRVPELSYGDIVQTYKAICAHSLLPQVAERPEQQAAGA